MKKLLIGCGVVSLLLFCVLVGVAIWGVIKVKRIHQTFVQLKDAYEETNRLYSFSTPNPPAMDKDRLETFLVVRSEFGAAIEGELAMLSRLVDATQTAKSENRTPDFSWQDLKAPVGLPKRVSDAHVKALKDHSMSLDEYLWYSKMVTGTTLKAAREGKKVSEQILRAYAQAYAQVPKEAHLPPPPEGQLPDLAPMEQLLQVTDVPFLPENFELIQDHAGEVAKYPQLSFVDLFLRQQSVGKSPETLEPTPKAEMQSTPKAEMQSTPKAEKEPATP